MARSPEEIVIAKVFEHVFMPRAMESLAVFLDEYKKTILMQHEYEIEIGHEVSMHPNILDFRPAAEVFVKTLSDVMRLK